MSQSYWPNANKPWTRKADRELLRLFKLAEKKWPKDAAKGKYSYRSRVGHFVAKRMGRTTSAVLGRRGILEICRCRELAS